jgi:hypothetical protein
MKAETIGAKVNIEFRTRIGGQGGRSRWTALPTRNYLPLEALRSRSNRSAVRFFAAAFAALRARSERSSAVMFLAAVLPPSAPVLRAISAIAARTSGGILIAMASSYNLGRMDRRVNKKVQEGY